MQSWDVSPRPIHSPGVVLHLSGARSGFVAPTGSLQLPVVSGSISTQQDVLDLTASRFWGYDPWAPSASSSSNQQTCLPSGSNASSSQPGLDGPHLYPSISDFYKSLTHAQKLKFCKEIDEDLEVAHCVQVIDDTYAFNDFKRAWLRHSCSTKGCRSTCWSCLYDYPPHDDHYCEQCYLAW